MSLSPSPNEAEVATDLLSTESGTQNFVPVEPPSHQRLSRDAAQRRRTRARRRWRCTTRGCPHRHQVLRSREVVRVSGTLRCPHCKGATLKRVDPVAPGPKVNWFCNNALCERSYDHNQPITKEELDRNAGASVCPECGDSISAAGEHGMLPKHITDLEKRRRFANTSSCPEGA